MCRPTQAPAIGLFLCVYLSHLIVCSYEPYSDRDDRWCLKTSLRKKEATKADSDQFNGNKLKNQAKSVSWKTSLRKKKSYFSRLTSFMERSTPPPPPKKKKKSHGKRHSVRKKLLKCTLISLMERSQTSTNLKCLWLGQSNNPYCLPGILTRP